MNEPLPPPDVSILIVAYNSQAIIADCLGSIAQACARHSYEVLLIDNGTGATAYLVATHFPHVKIVASRGNVGFAAGNNLLADEAKGRHLLLLNPDVVLKPQAIDILMDATATYPETSAWGGVTLDKHNQPDFGNTLGFPSLREMATRILLRTSQEAPTRLSFDHDAEVPVLSGSFAMFTRSAWDEVGGLDDRYFLYCEEVDLFYRLAKAGHRFRRIARSRANHDVGHGDGTSPHRELYLSAGIMQFTRLHWSRPESLVAFFLIWAASLVRLTAGMTMGWASPNFANVAARYRLVATRPNHWRHGYDPARGLMAKLRR